MKSPVPSRSSGFTIMELLAAITIVGLLLAVAVPSSMRLYQSMQYRSTVKGVVTLLASARYKAVNTGESQDVVINPKTRELRFNQTIETLPAGVNIVVHSARELNTRDAGVIRFYPEGGSSGGGVDIEIPERRGVRIDVDWLIGRVTQEAYALN